MNLLQIKMKRTDEGIQIHAKCSEMFGQLFLKDIDLTQVSDSEQWNNKFVNYSQRAVGKLRVDLVGSQNLTSESYYNISFIRCPQCYTAEGVTIDIPGLFTTDMLDDYCSNVPMEVRKAYKQYLAPFNRVVSVQITDEGILKND